MSDHSVSCSIYNGLTDTIGLSTQTPNSGTSWVNTDANNSNDIYAGATGGFTASGSEMAGCGGTVTYNLPNNDQLIIVYNTSTDTDTAYCVALLQSGSNGTAGTDAYYCSATAVSTLSDDSITVTISVYEL